MVPKVDKEEGGEGLRRGRNWLEWRGREDTHHPSPLLFIGANAHVPKVHALWLSAQAFASIPII